MNKLKNNTGFTLVEIAVVLVIVGVLLGYTVALWPVQQELRQYSAANKEMDRIISAIYAFAQVNGRLPCADSLAAPDGQEDGGGAADCTNNVGWYGLLPARTLGIDGNYDANNSLLDPWGTPYRYQVTTTDRGLSVGGDFVRTNDIQVELLQNMGPPVQADELSICTINPTNNPNDVTCGGVASTIANGIPAVVLSLGKDRGLVLPQSNIQVENTDNTLDGTTDIVFVKASRSDATGAEYDDIVKWISPNILYSKMIDAGRLP